MKTEEASIKIDGLRKIRKQGLISLAEYYMAVAGVYNELKNQARIILLENGYNGERQAEYLYFAGLYNSYKIKELQAESELLHKAYENELRKLQNGGN